MQFKSQIDEELLDLGIVLHQLLLHQDLFLVLDLAVLRDGGVAVELQLVVAVLRLAWLVVGVLVGVVVGQGYLAVFVVGVLVRLLVGQCQLAELLLMGGGMIGNRIAELEGGLASAKLSLEEARTRKRKLEVRARYALSSSHLIQETKMYKVTIHTRCFSSEC